MPFLIQFLALIFYAVAALAMAIILPQNVTWIGGRDAWIIAGLGFLAAVVLHEFIARGIGGERRFRAVEGRLERHRQAIEAVRGINRGLLSDLERVREQMLELSDVVEMTAEGANKALQGQMQALQRQLGEISRDWPTDGEDIHVQVADFEAKMSSAESLKRPLAPHVPANLGDGDALALMQDALENGRVDLHIQPIVSLPQRKQRFFEAYARLRTPDGQVMLPQDYAAIAAKRGLAGVVDNLLLIRCVQLIRRAKKRNIQLKFFVNISNHTVSDARFLGQFVEFMTENRNLAGDLIFEFRHDDFIRHEAEAVQQLRRLSGLGFKFSIDKVERLDLDLAALAAREVSYLKIPAALLLAPGAENAALPPEHIKAAARAAGIDLIGHRIETERQVIEVLDYQFDYGQGYLFGEPRPGRWEKQDIYS